VKLFAETESSEQCVEQVLHSGPAGNSVDGQPSNPQFLGDQEGIGHIASTLQR
jgi:hypothetical protein